MHRLRLGTVTLTLTLFTACGGPKGGSVPQAFSDRQLVADFADHVVVPTYGLLAARVAALDAAVRALAASRGPAELAAAQAAWVQARVPWEQAEGFLFGPVDSFGYDPAIDSWPVNHTDLDAVLGSSAAFTPAYVANLQETQKGFHTAEYLLFGVGRSKTAAGFTSRELEYLTALTAELVTVTQALKGQWTDAAGGRPPYRDVVATAGEAGNSAYPSLTAAAQEILGGMIGICDEVANGKIADPYDAHDVTLVESQFAFNSIADFQDNVRSVQNAYTGSVAAAGTGGRGLSAHVAESNAELDGRVRAEIQAAIDAIGAIPPPFRDAIHTPSAYDD
ncbi:MAG: peptidase M75 [Archangiaceae bacterium]|nr:peptidase M75 [Archangiaceae bacterium]